ncbi:MAG: phosphate acetyltransferase [Lachnospiraceae bacterium]|nr:phosphate acetyltransferase [Lachnospiraceae bacterium]
MSKFGFGQMIDRLKKEPKTIVFTEGTDSRILEASSRLLASNFLKPVLIGDPDEIYDCAEDSGFNIRGANIISPHNFEDFDKMVDDFMEVRKGKIASREEAEKLLRQNNYFGTMLVKMGYADCLLGGATYSTADTVRPALQLIKTKPGNTIVSSCFILVRPGATGENVVLAMGDCGININPNEDELVEIAEETINCAKVFGVEPCVAFLSYSTNGSGTGPDVDKMRNAANKAKARNPLIPIDGEMQFDAAVSPSVAKKKHPNSPVAGHANTFIFPDINAGNIGYKIAQRMGNFEAYGPILLGLNSPINDLSRGCTATEVYSMAIITAAFATKQN